MKTSKTALLRWQQDSIRRHHECHSPVRISQTATSIEKKEDGAPIEVEGELCVDEWESDGKKRTEMYIKVRRWTFPPRDFNDGEVNKSSSERSEDKNWYD